MDEVAVLLDQVLGTSFHKESKDVNVRGLLFQLSRNQK